MDREKWDVAMRVEPSYLAAAFEEMESTRGSIDGYFAEELGLSPSALEQIRHNILS